MDKEVPKLFLQPFVENAIIHGFAEKEQGGVIEIKGWSDGEMVFFTVADNGRGIEKEQVDQLRSGKIGSTGMPNVEKRIKLLYGSQFGVAVHSDEGSGTTIVIRMGTFPGKQDKTEVQ